MMMILSSCNDNEDENSSSFDYSDCLVQTHTSSLEVVTMNLKEFPIDDEQTIAYVADLINQLDADVIALQEISSEYWLDQLTASLEGWEGVFTSAPSYTMSLAYLYKTSEVEIDQSATKVIFANDYNAFPRAPLVIKVYHYDTGLETYLINNHLKCCNGSEDRRQDASEKLQTYINTYLPDENVIVLGDFNDTIDESYSSDNVFWNFISDADNFQFADMDIAMGDDDEWSYPSYPSHIDHILISNELFDNLQTTVTIKPDQCLQNYSIYGSDHRPIMAVFN